MIRIFFSGLDLAIAQAKQHGGWIAECADGTFQWFDARSFTLTAILLLLTQEGRGDAKIGPWPAFDPGHESHTILLRRQAKPGLYRCSACGRTYALGNGDRLPHGDDHCVHEWEPAG